MKYTISIALFFIAFNLNAQDKTTAGQVIEGGRVVVDLIDVLKSGTNNGTLSGMHCKELKAGNICIRNAQVLELTVKITSRRSGSSVYELVIQKDT